MRREYEDAGVRVVTHGQRGYLWQDTDVAFLYRQLHEMRQHKRVVSNRMSSAILYAASAGVEVGVYGDPMALESDHAVLGGVGKPRRIWPEMHQFSVPMDYAAEVANRELGADEMLLPAEVIDAFGWAPEIAQPGPPAPAPPLEDEPVGLRAPSSSPAPLREPSRPRRRRPLAPAISVDASVDDPDELADDHGPQAGTEAGTQAGTKASSKATSKADPRAAEVRKAAETTESTAPASDAADDPAMEAQD